jgi:uncharacterized DUF497 family protein
MMLYSVIWKEKFVEKLALKHGVEIEEVEEILFSKPHVRLFEKGHIKGENLYAAYGKTSSGKYLITFFVLKNKTSALPISAREMTESERKYYDKQKETR